MIQVPASAAERTPRRVELETDLVVAGGGLAGTCAAITAARAGIRVVLIQDRPVLGGNASSEVRLWILGATSHMGNNNRWAREGGVVDEILVENMHRNPEGNAVFVDALLLEKVCEESNITLLLNTAVDRVEKNGADTIAFVDAFCSQNQTRYTVRAPLYCDASGDGIVGYLAGAPFRMGAEAREEFGEGFAPTREYGELLGHSLYFYSRDTGKPVEFIPPSFALEDIKVIPRYRDIKASDSGARFWWFEYGGRLDTVHDTEEIKWELWRVAWGAWNYIKNSGRFPEARTFTLEWMGMIPGKRESRRFEGDYILTQQDIIEQKLHPDAVSHGGWAIDLHPGDGVYSALPSCMQWHSKGTYQIPYRALYSRSIRNLFLAGRIISVSHVAFGSTRVMATCAHAAQAAAMAAVLCRKEALLPAGLNEPSRMCRLQRELLRTGQNIPGVPLDDPDDLVRRGEIAATSRMVLDTLPAGGETRPLDASRAMLIPLPAGPAPAITLVVDAAEATTLQAELRGSCRVGNYTPDRVLGRAEALLKPGRSQTVRLDFACSIETPQYVFVCLMSNPAVSVHLTGRRLTGVLALSHSLNKDVAKGATQMPPPGSGIESFEFWLPERRPRGKNLAISIEPALDLFGPRQVANGYARPTTQPNAWVADWADKSPCLSVRWPEPQTIRRIEIGFDTDFDHPMESLLWGHPERDMPFTVKRFRLRDAQGTVLHECAANHQTRRSIRLAEPARTDALHLEILETHGAPAAVFDLRCYAE